MYWKKETLNALNRFSQRHNTSIITLQELKREELDNIRQATYSWGKTPENSLRKFLQDLRKEGIIYFMGGGKYLLLDKPINIEKENLSEKAIDFAIEKEKLLIGIISANNKQTITRQRIGQNRIRELTLENYRYECALCDVKNKELLETSHISRWADDPDNRGKLSNIICLCMFHHVLFENGYISLDDNYQILRKLADTSLIVDFIIKNTEQFKIPKANPPAQEFLQKHRRRSGFKK